MGNEAVHQVGMSQDDAIKTLEQCTDWLAIFACESASSKASYFEQQQTCKTAEDKTVVD